MHGKVVGLNGDLCAVSISSGITVFEIFGDHVTELGDVISGNLEASGAATLYNETKKVAIDAFIECWSCSINAAIKYFQREQGKSN